MDVQNKLKILEEILKKESSNWYIGYYDIRPIPGKSSLEAYIPTIFKIIDWLDANYVEYITNTIKCWSGDRYCTLSFEPYGILLTEWDISLTKPSFTEFHNEKVKLA